MYPENNSSNSQTASLSGILFNHRRFMPWYNDQADYNTDAKSYYDYLARTGKILDAITYMINEINKKLDNTDLGKYIFNDTKSIDLNNKDFNITADLKVSENSNNTLKVINDGILYENTDLNVLLDSDLINRKHILSPKIVRNAVMQNIYYDVDLSQWYITQSDGMTNEGFVISRLNENGSMISNVWVKNGGHGTDVIFHARGRETPIVYFQDGKNYRSFVYNDFITLNNTDCEISFTPPANGNGMSSYSDKYFSHINNLTGINTLNIYKYEFKNNTFIFDNEVSSIDITDKIPIDRNVLQGLSIINKSYVTGLDDDNDDVYLMVYAGNGNIEANILLYEYNHISKDIKFIKKIGNLQDVVVKNLNSSNNYWKNFEPEGITTISMNTKYGIVSGIVYGLSVNVIGKRQHYLYGILNEHLYNYLSSTNSVDDFNTKYVDVDTEYLYNIYNTGTYELNANNAINIKDFPSIWRGVNSQADWILKNTYPNQNGDVVQTLIRRGVGSPMEYYIRTLNFTAGYYGKDYKPSSVGYWNVININGNQSRTLTSTNNVLFRKLSDFAIPGISYYISSNSSSEIHDMEGLDTILEGRAFKITTYSWGGVGDSVMQKVDYLKNGNYEYAVRFLSVKKDTYGPGMLINTTTLPKWNIFKGV